MESQISPLDQYKLLREEVMQCMREMYTTQVGAIVAAASVYTWLFIHKQQHPLPNFVWVVAPFIILAGALHSFELRLRIRSIGNYLKHLEEVAASTGFPGWEHYKHKHSAIDARTNILATAIWGFEFAGAILVCWLSLR
jgi:hypothetical protein